MEIVMTSYISWPELLSFTSTEMEIAELVIAIVMLLYAIKKDKK